MLARGWSVKLQSDANVRSVRAVVAKNNSSIALYFNDLGSRKLLRIDMSAKETRDLVAQLSLALTEMK